MRKHWITSAFLMAAAASVSPHAFATSVRDDGSTTPPPAAAPISDHTAIVTWFGVHSGELRLRSIDTPDCTVILTSYGTAAGARLTIELTMPMSDGTLMLLQSAIWNDPGKTEVEAVRQTDTALDILYAGPGDPLWGTTYGKFRLQATKSDGKLSSLRIQRLSLGDEEGVCSSLVSE